MWIKGQAGGLVDVSRVYLSSESVRGSHAGCTSSVQLGEYKDAETAKAVLDMIEDFIAGKGHGPDYDRVEAFAAYGVKIDPPTLFVMPPEAFIDCQREADLVAKQALDADATRKKYGVPPLSYSGYMKRMARPCALCKNKPRSCGNLGDPTACAHCSDAHSYWAPIYVCGAGFKSYMAAGIDVEKATESILKSCRSIGPVVTTLPIPDSVMHFDFLTHNSKNVVGVSFDKATNIVSVEFDDPDAELLKYVQGRNAPTAEAPIEKCCNTCGNVPGAPACICCIASHTAKTEYRHWRQRGGK